MQLNFLRFRGKTKAMDIVKKTALIASKLDKPLVFVGLMGAGKTSIGRLVADKLKLEFVDSDDVVIEKEGCSIAELFDTKGEEHFRDIERQTIIELSQQAELKIISTGGGAFMNDQTREAIKDNAYSIFLKADIDVLLARVGDGVGRPLFEGRKAEDVLQELIKERYPTYQQADISVPTYNEPIEETLNRVLEALYSQLVNR